MTRNASLPWRLLKLIAAASLSPLLMIGLLAVAGAQEPTGEESPAATVEATGETTPAGTAGPSVEPTPGPEVRTVVRMEIDAGIEPIERNTEFEVRVLVDEVEHLAGFSFFISYDPKKLEPVKRGEEATPEGITGGGLSGEPVKTRGLGDLLTTSPRGNALVCDGPAVDRERVGASCVTAAAPLCLGGPAGAAGSGLVGAVYFKSKGGGMTTLTLTADTGLVLDDAAPPCDPADPRPQAIPHRRENLPIELGKAAGGNTLLYVIIGAVVIVIAAAAAGGYLLYGRRRAPVV